MANVNLGSYDEVRPQACPNFYAQIAMNYMTYVNSMCEYFASALRKNCLALGEYLHLSLGRNKQNHELGSSRVLECNN